MQLFANQVDGKLIFSNNARKKINYTCSECGQIVRLRSGIHKRAHFYHLSPNETCSQQGKSITHLQLQCYLKKTLPGTIELEHKFHEINRIADVVWIEKKLIFEIQCSSITLEEVRQRNLDYQSLGFEVIWILHDRLYNQYRISAAEYFLLDIPHYFTNMNPLGQGYIYEQLAVIVKMKRKVRFEKLFINLSYPIFERISNLEGLPKLIQKRAAYPLHFFGDSIDHVNKKFIDSDYINQIIQAEKEWSVEEIPFSEQPLGHALKKLTHRWVTQPYFAFFRLILERMCR